MSDYRQSICEHLLASENLLEKGELSDDEAEALSKKIKGFLSCSVKKTVHES